MKHLVGMIDKLVSLKKNFQRILPWSLPLLRLPQSKQKMKALWCKRLQVFEILFPGIQGLENKHSESLFFGIFSLLVLASHNVLGDVLGPTTWGKA